MERGRGKASREIQLCEALPTASFDGHLDLQRDARNSEHSKPVPVNRDAETLGWYICVVRSCAGILDHVCYVWTSHQASRGPRTSTEYQ
jgi:hypothetical protein